MGHPRDPEHWREAIANPSPLNRARDGRTKVAIFGFARVGRSEWPTDDPDWEVWGLNSGWWYPRDTQDRFRADRWFELHEMHAQTPEELEAIRGCPVPIYLTDEPTPDIPTGVRFPLDDLDARFGLFAPYACTFAYQIAFAIAQGFTTIGLYGVELQLGTVRERTVERASVAYWVGYARGLGIDVVVPLASGIVTHPYRYGFDYTREKDIIEVYAMETTAAGLIAEAHAAARRFMKKHHPVFDEVG